MLLTIHIANYSPEELATFSPSSGVNYLVPPPRLLATGPENVNGRKMSKRVNLLILVTVLAKLIDLATF